MNGVEPDDYWLDDEEPILSVTAALVVDLFGADEVRVVKAIRRELAKMGDW
jgi:hypothetical protein